MVLRILLSSLFACIFFSYSIHALQLLELKERLREARVSQDYTNLGHYLRLEVRTKRGLKRLSKLSKNIHDSKFQNAVRFASEIDSKKKNLRIYPGELVEIALFIQTKFLGHIKEKEYYVAKEKTGCRFAVEFDPKTKKSFIVLEGVRRTLLGRGGSKVATKAIFFDLRKPEFVVRLLQTKPHEKEYGFFRKLKGAKGIMKTKAFTLRKEGDTTYFTIYADLYSPGALGRALKNKRDFCLKDKINIALGLTRGLSSLHKQHIIHRDLKANNCLINIEKTKRGKKELTAVLSDFGAGRRAIDCVGDLSNIIRSNTAPEGIFHKDLKKKDYYGTDVFAMGNVLYYVYYKTLPPWKKRSNYTRHPEDFQDRYDHLVKELNDQTGLRRKKLALRIRKKTATNKDRLEYQILKMVHPDPLKRGPAKKHARAFQRIHSQNR